MNRSIARCRQKLDTVDADATTASGQRHQITTTASSLPPPPRDSRRFLQEIHDACLQKLCFSVWLTQIAPG
jgi:hypothetical protein